MARFYGSVGFTLGDIEISPGVFKENIAIRNYYGDVMRRRVNWQKGQLINDNLQINNQISILADEYAEKNAYAIKWVEWKGFRWKVSSIEFERPRMILTIGDVYNENHEEESSV